MKFEYVYRAGETPEERLRNKLQPLFALVDIIEDGSEPSPGMLKMCSDSREDIRALLNDITPFYGAINKKDYTQNNTNE